MTGDIRPASLPIANNNCCSSNESTPHSKTRPTGDMTDQGNHGPQRGNVVDYMYLIGI